MRRIILLSIVFLLSTVWAAGQNDGALPGESADTNRVTLEGCLGGAVGNFTLTDRTGVIYQLTGNTQRMDDHVGKTGRVTGVKPSGKPAPGSMSEDIDDIDSPPELSVITFEHVSSSCDETQVVP